MAWSQGGLAYLLAGEGDKARLAELAEAVRKNGQHAQR